MVINKFLVTMILEEKEHMKFTDLSQFYLDSYLT